MRRHTAFMCVCSICSWSPVMLNLALHKINTEKQLAWLCTSEQVRLCVTMRFGREGGKIMISDQRPYGL